MKLKTVLENAYRHRRKPKQLPCTPDVVAAIRTSVMIAKLEGDTHVRVDHLYRALYFRENDG